LPRPAFLSQEALAMTNVFSCFEEWHELSMQRQWEIVQALQKQMEASRRYFDHCQRVNDRRLKADGFVPV